MKNIQILISLILQDQWKKKKQTKQEAAAARRAKLDPDSDLNRNAKEIMDERAKSKRKQRDQDQEEEGGDEEWDDYIPIEGVDAERPLEGLKMKTPEENQKAKTDATQEDTTNVAETPSKLSRREEKKAAKKEKRKEKKADKKSQVADEPQEKDAAQGQTPSATPKAQKQASKKNAKSPAAKPNNAPVNASNDEEMDVEMTDAANLKKDNENADAVSSSNSEPQSPTFDTTESSFNFNEPVAEPASTTTSVSSVPSSEKPKHIKIPADTDALRVRLAKKIEELRAARKADGPDGKPIRTRQELIEARRQKEAKRKAHKQELRMQAKLDEQRKREEALASNSPGMMSPAVELDEATASNNFAFGRVAFGDGAQMSHDLSYILNKGKKKGPSDPKTALLKVQNQKKRLEELDEEKRKDIAEKEAWLTARRRVEGEKIRDDETLLKKAIKRKDINKRKSEKAWKERADGVKMAQKQRQKKREDNLRARREDKVLGKAGKKKKGGVTKKKGGRPGFEGSLGVGGRKK